MLRCCAVLSALAVAALAAPTSCYSSYPRHYVAPRVADPPAIDGVVDGDPAWATSPWTDPFVDITGRHDRKPYLETRAKMAWDDRCLYVGAVLEEPQAWANLTLHNSVIFRDSDFEVFVDPDGSTHYYKELEFNARAVDWNLLVVRPYLNGGPAVCNATEPGQCATSAPDFNVSWWDVSPSIRAAASVDGALNDPLVGSKSWSIEACIPLEQYVSRVQWHVHVEKRADGTAYYAKDEGRPEENWLWQPTGVVNVHLPERWGYVQFASGPSTPARPDPTWPVRSALAAVYEAEKTYAALYGTGYTDSIEALVQNARLDKDVAAGSECAQKPEIRTEGGGFVATVLAADKTHVGRIRDDRYTTVDWL
eukprot:m51a1_g2300 hypothetical protein (365) ;mRNA; f:442195-443565